MLDGLFIMSGINGRTNKFRVGSALNNAGYYLCETFFKDEI